MSEVLSVKKLRLSISGWFHGPDVPRPEPALVPRPPMSDPVLADVREFLCVEFVCIWQRVSMCITVGLLASRTSPPTLR